MPVLERLLSDGHEIMKIFSFPGDGQFSFHDALKSKADALGILFQTDKVMKSDVDSLIEEGCRCFLSCFYLYKIPAIDESKAYGLNIHPTLLPEGRGKAPMPWLILKYPEYSGFTIHKLAQKFDQGDIIYQERVPISDQDDIETLGAKFLMRFPDAISKTLENIDRLWSDAKPQNGGSQWPVAEAQDRLLDPEKTVEALDKILRAFSRFGSLIFLGQDPYIVLQARVWQEAHHYLVGHIVVHTGREMTLAVKGGFLCLKDYYKFEEKEGDHAQN